MANTHQLILDLLGLLFELLLVGQILPLAAATHAKVLTEGLSAQRRTLYKAHNDSLHIATMMLAHLHIDNIARHGHRHKDNLVIHLAHGLTLGSKRGYMQTLDKG